MIIPENTLMQFLTGCLTFLRNDWNTTADKTQTFLANVWGDEFSNKTSYHKEAGEIFSRKKDDPRALDVHLFFNAEQALSRPIIHITLAGETPTYGEIGLGESGERSMNHISFENNTIQSQFLQRLDTNFSVVITSTSELECLIIYRSLQCVIFAAMDSLQLLGWGNPKISGNDLRMPTDQNVNQLYMKSINISGFVDLQVNQLFKKPLITQAIINAAIPII